MFIIKFYMFYNEFYTFYNKVQTNCNPIAQKKLLPCDLTVAKATAFFVLHQITAYTAIIRWLHT